MKVKIKYIELTEGCRPDLSNTKKGDWIDLRAAQTITLDPPKFTGSRIGNAPVSFYSTFIPLGVSLQLPKGYEAVINARSSLYISHGVMLWNGQGVIDNSYRGDLDEWMVPVVAIKGGHTISKGDRIVQFRIQLSQHATSWQKLKWLFSSGIKFEKVETLNNSNRGGFGSTGKN